MKFGADRLCSRSGDTSLLLWHAAEELKLAPSIKEMVYVSDWYYNSRCFSQNLLIVGVAHVEIPLRRENECIAKI